MTVRVLAWSPWIGYPVEVVFWVQGGKLKRRVLIPGPGEIVASDVVFQLKDLGRWDDFCRDRGDSHPYGGCWEYDDVGDEGVEGYLEELSAGG